MSLTERERRELSDLASSAADGVLSASELGRLEQVLRDSPDARAYYVRFMNVSAGLAWAARDPAEVPEIAGAIERDQRRGWWTATAAAAAIAFAIFGTWAISRRPVTPLATNAVGVATLSTNMNVEWADAREPEHIGNLLQPGWVRIKSGLAQIDFLNGASVWLEGPVELRIDSPRAAFCASGKLVAQVPHGAGDFCLSSPHFSVDQKGTGFGVEVAQDHRDALHVFRGTVDVMVQDSRAHTEIGPGQALVVDQAGTTRLTTADPATFSREEFSPRWDSSSYFPGPWVYSSWNMGPGPDWWSRAPMGPPPAIFPGQWKGADPLDPVRDLLGSNEQRWAAIKNPLQDFLGAQWKSWGMDNNPDESSVSRATWNLRFALEDPTSTDADLQKRVAALRDARDKARKALDQKETALKQVLTDGEEAQLVSQGYMP